MTVNTFGAQPHPYRTLSPLMAISFIKWRTNKHASVLIIGIIAKQTDHQLQIAQFKNV